MLIQKNGTVGMVLQYASRVQIGYSSIQAIAYSSRFSFIWNRAYDFIRLDDLLY